MKTCNTYILAAALAVAGLGMSTRAAENTGIRTDAGAQMQQTGAQMADESTTKDVRSDLAKIINDGVEKNKFNSFLGYLAKADRERVGSASKSNLDTLNSAIDQFRQDFKSKYNQDFDISANQLQSAMIYAGQDKNSATVSFANPALSSNQPIAPGNNNLPNPGSSNTANGGATADRTLNTTGNDRTVSNRTGEMSASDTTSMTAGNRTGPANSGSNSGTTVHGNDTTANPGVVAGPPDSTITNTSIAMSSLTLNLVNEGHLMNAWRINAPQLSLEQIKQNLTKHIQMLDDQKAAWPSDVNAAYQAAAYHVLQAFNDSTVASER